MRLEALERDKLSFEIILFGVMMHPDKDARAIATDSALRVLAPASDIVFNFRIPGRGDRPPSLVVRLFSRDARNR